MFLGVLFAQCHLVAPAELRARRERLIPLLAAGLLIVGAAVWHVWPGRLLVREGCCEMFYNPTIGFALTATGCVLVLYWITRRSQSLALWSPVRALGESSLFMDIFHLLVIGGVIENVWDTGDTGGRTFTLMCALLLLAMVAVGYGLRALKARWRNIPFLPRFILGA